MPKKNHPVNHVTTVRIQLKNLINEREKHLKSLREVDEKIQQVIDYIT